MYSCSALIPWILSANSLISRSRGSIFSNKDIYISYPINLPDSTILTSSCRLDLLHIMHIETDRFGGNRWHLVAKAIGMFASNGCFNNVYTGWLSRSTLHNMILGIRDLSSYVHVPVWEMTKTNTIDSLLLYLPKSRYQGYLLHQPREEPCQAIERNNSTIWNSLTWKVTVILSPTARSS